MNNNFEHRSESMLFSIGWNETFSFRHEILEPYNARIGELYFGLPDEWDTDVREHFGHMPLNQYFTELRKIKKHYPRIPLTLLFNWNCMGKRCSLDGLNELDNNIRKLDKIVDTVAVSNLLLAEQILANFPAKQLSLSVRLNIDTFEQVRHLVEKYGESRIWCINIGRNAIYDFALLRRISQSYPGIKIKIIVNEFCTRRCLDSDLHSNMKAHNTYIAQERFICGSYNESNWWRFLTGMGILPRDAHRWQGYVDLLKLSSRWLNTEHLRYVFETYLESREVTLGEIVNRIGQGGCWFKINPTLCAKLDMDALHPPEFFDMRSSCNFDCERCCYCEQTASHFIHKDS